jgi:hypothetical protein
VPKPMTPNTLFLSGHSKLARSVDVFPGTSDTTRSSIFKVIVSWHASIQPHDRFSMCYDRFKVANIANTRIKAPSVHTTRMSSPEIIFGGVVRPSNAGGAFFIDNGHFVEKGQLRLHFDPRV